MLADLLVVLFLKCCQIVGLQNVFLLEIEEIEHLNLAHVLFLADYTKLTLFNIVMVHVLFVRAYLEIPNFLELIVFLLQIVNLCLRFSNVVYKEFGFANANYAPAI